MAPSKPGPNQRRKIKKQNKPGPSQRRTKTLQWNIIPKNEVLTPDLYEIPPLQDNLAPLRQIAEIEHEKLIRKTKKFIQTKVDKIKAKIEREGKKLLSNRLYECYADCQHAAIYVGTCDSVPGIMI